MDAQDRLRSWRGEDATAPQNETSGPKRGSSRLVGIIQIAVVIAVVAFIFFITRAPSHEDVAQRRGTLGSISGDGAPAPTVRVVKPTATTKALTIGTTGTVQARSRIALTPQVSGRVIGISYSLRSGGAFTKGEELLRIDPRDFALAVKQAEASVAVAEATLKLRRAEGDAARANHALLHPGEPVPPLVAKEPQIQQAIAQVASARAALEVANLNLERTVFSLPFDGRVISSTAEIGQLVAPGQPFGEAFATDSLEVRAQITSEELHAIEPAIGRRARIVSGGVSYPAVVDRVSAEVDNRSRFQRLFLRFEEVTSVPPGTFVDVEVEGPKIGNVFVLPEMAEQVNGQVWIVDKGKLEAVSPTLHGRERTQFVVDRFEAGQGVVLGSVPGGRDGLTVNVTEEGE